MEQHQSGGEEKDAVSSEVMQVQSGSVSLCNEIKLKEKVGVFNPR